jgi:hypothetical protein
MRIPAELRKDHEILQPMALTPWKHCTVVAATMAGDERPYAVVITEHAEFEFVPWYMLKPTKEVV